MLAEPPSQRLLANIALGLSRTERLWSDCLVDDLSERPAVRLLETDRFEAWLLQWDVGQSVDLHDHGGSAGALVVLHGELVEVTALPDGALIRQALPQGRLRTFAPGHVHDVLNLGSAPAASIHVYSPALTSMTFYDPVSLERVRTEIVESVPPVLNQDISRVLHPARRI